MCGKRRFSRKFFKRRQRCATMFPLMEVPEKCSVKPNEYIQDDRGRIKGMINKLKSGRIDPDESPEEIVPKTEEEKEFIDVETATNADTKIPRKNVLKPNHPVGHTEQKNEVQQHNCVGESTIRANSIAMDENLEISHTTTTSSLHSFNSSRKESSSPSVPKVYKIPPKDSKPIYANDNIPFLNPPHDLSSSSPSSVVLGASNAIHESLLSPQTVPNTNGPSYHDQHRVPREVEKDCDFGWVSNTSRHSDNKTTRHSDNKTTRHSDNRQSNPNHYHDHSIKATDKGYVNDNQANHIPGQEATFTVTEQNGNCLRFTIAESGIHIQFPQERSSSSSNTSDTRYHRNRHSNLLTMTPSLTPLPHEECPKNEEFHDHNGTSETASKPHFELSMASYSRLMAYCDTNKLNRGCQSIFRQRHSKGHLVQSTTSSSASNSQVRVNDLCRLAKVLETVEECPWYWGAITGQEAKKVLRDAETGTYLLRDSSDPRHLFSLSVNTSQGQTSIRIVYNDGSFRFDSDIDDVNNSRRNGRNGGSSDPTRPDHPNYVKKVASVFTCVVKLVLHHTKHLGLKNPKATTSSSPRRNKCSKCSAKLSESSTSDANSVSPHNEEDSSYRPERFMCYWINRRGRQEIPVLLSKPISKKQFFPSLQSLCRQTLNVSFKLWAHEDTVDRFPLPNSLKKYIKRYPYPV